MFNHDRQSRDLSDLFGQIVTNGSNFGATPARRSTFLGVPAAVLANDARRQVVDYCRQDLYHPGRQPAIGPVKVRAPSLCARWPQDETPPWVSEGRPRPEPQGWQAQAGSNIPTGGLVLPAGPPLEPCNCFGRDARWRAPGSGLFNRTARHPRNSSRRTKPLLVLLF